MALTRRVAAASQAQGPPLVAVAALLAGFLATQFPDLLTVPFINDDYLFLDRVRAASFGDLWRLDRATFGWYRPWSRELHYWVLSRVFGPNETAFHLASVALWLAVLTAFFALVRRVARARAAAIATAGVAAMAAWAVPVLWVAAVQDLWMLLFSILCLHAVARGSVRWATLAYALALLSKETAAPLPAVALAYAIVVERRPLRAALVRVAPFAAVLVVWALVHPALGGRLWMGGAGPEAVAQATPPLSVAVRTVATLVNVDHPPRPVGGWGGPFARALPAVALLGALVLWGGRAAAPKPPLRPVAIVAVVWAVSAWAPVFAPGLGWHAYYTLAGALGAWLLLALALAPRPGVALAVVAVLAVLRSGHAATWSDDWGTEWYQRRAAAFLRFMRDDLRRALPSPPAHARLWFYGVPSQVGFITEGAPALRVWYGDTTLTGGYFGAYHARPAGRPTGDDFFFRYDSTTGWVPIVDGPEDLATARARNREWELDHVQLASMFARAEEWPRAAIECEKLATEDGDPDHLLNAGVSREMMGDTLAALGWYRRAAARMGPESEPARFAQRIERALAAGRSPP